MQLLIEQGESARDSRWSKPANQLTQAQAKKNGLEQGVIRNAFELMIWRPLKYEDVAEQMEASAQEKRRVDRQQAGKAEGHVKSMRIVLNKL